MRYEFVAFPLASDFLAKAEPWLLTNEVENNLILSHASEIAAGSRDSPHNLFATVESSGEISACLFRTPPWNLFLTHCPDDAVGLVVDRVGSRYPDLPGVLGFPETVRRFALEWARSRGMTFRESMRQRIYGLDRLILPPSTPVGQARAVRSDEIALLTDWLTAFYEEMGFPIDDPVNTGKRHVSEEAAWFWCNPDPVSMAVYTGNTRNGVRIGLVYTPPAERGRGYGSAITASVSRMALDRGKKFCCLFADVANPSSNRIYQRMGYRPVADVVDYAFEPQR